MFDMQELITFLALNRLQKPAYSYAPGKIAMQIRSEAIPGQDPRAIQADNYGGRCLESEQCKGKRRDQDQINAKQLFSASTERPVHRARGAL